ncbi:LLM class flavin-dependent oxidoreductase [Kitasatospora hibisci]|uniref:LLM class flavin-dependent oxidoreductase n=1 Tax=Kitasatospora hibisci TaxID=3369522 RepID=UPI0037545F4F
MAMIHQVFRRESRLLAELVQGVHPGDTARSRILAEHRRQYAVGLHAHHTGGDEMLWPVLLPRLDLDAEQVLAMEAQHRELDEGIAAVQAVMDRWQAQALREDRDELVQFGPFADPDRSAAMCAALEAPGCHSLWVADRLLAPLAPPDGYPGGKPMPVRYGTHLDPLLALGVAAMATERVRLGSSTLNALWQPPLVLARALTTLDSARRPASARLGAEMRPGGNPVPGRPGAGLGSDTAGRAPGPRRERGAA